MTAETEIRIVLQQWLAAFNARDLDGLMTLYDAEAVYAGGSAPLQSGADTIRAFYDPVLGQVTGVVQHREEALFVGGDMALLVGAFVFAPTEGQAVDDPSMGRVALVFRRDGQGAWRLLFDMDNTPPDVTRASFPGV